MRQSILTVLLLVVPCLAFAAEPVGVHRQKVGKIEVISLQDAEMQLPASLLKGIEAADAKAMLGGKDVADASINTFLVRMPDKTVLVDTGKADDGKGESGHLLQRLQAAAVDPAKIDLVLITHMHFDHMGGLLKPDGSRAFPKAVVRVAQAEHDAWLGDHAKVPEQMKAGLLLLKAAVAPYQVAGAYKPFAPDENLGKGIRAVPGLGHTPGHTVYVFTSEGRELWCIGDLIHVGAVQFARPKVAMVFDSDPDKAVATRREFFQKAAAAGPLLAATHLPFPGLVQIKVKGDSFVATPVK
jgi:glyoxylase-like metal-dependent hydrolase (beta-lactamase superfamily II)